MTKRNEYPYTEEDLQHFKQKINERLERLRDQLSGLNERRREFLESSNMEQYDYEEDSKMTQEVSRMNALIENDMNQIQALEAALMRIENKTYGICTESGNFIRRERLEVMPEATTCLQENA